jgi:hypothetical protein
MIGFCFLDMWIISHLSGLNDISHSSSHFSRNVKTNSIKTKELAYKTYVKPKVEYCSVAYMPTLERLKAVGGSFFSEGRTILRPSEFYFHFFVVLSSCGTVALHGLFIHLFLQCTIISYKESGIKIIIIN